MSQKRNLRAGFFIAAFLLCTTCGIAVHVFATNDAVEPVRVEVAPVAPEPAEPDVETPPPAVPETPAYSDEVVQATKLVWNEALDNPADAAAIVHMRMRSARSRGRTLSEELYYLHGDGRTRARSHASLRSDRATKPRRGDTRAWLGDLTADLHRPLGWPGTDAEWAVRATRIHALYDYVARVISGQVPDPCRGRARRWGGRMDAELIAMWQQRGEVILNCGRTMNTFLGN